MVDSMNLWKYNIEHTACIILSHSAMDDWYYDFNIKKHFHLKQWKHVFI